VGHIGTLTYTVTPPHYVDMDFRCTPHDASLFGQRGYAVLFFANYMHDVEDLALHFRGQTGPDAEESWIAADVPPGHPDWNQGGTYRSLDAADLTYDADHNFRLNSWSYDWPRFTQPFYYGRATHGMTLMLMFDRLHSDVDEIRFSLFKFKTKRHPRPAWDFQYVIKGIETGRSTGSSELACRLECRGLWKHVTGRPNWLLENVSGLDAAEYPAELGRSPIKSRFRHGILKILCNIRRALSSNWSEAQPAGIMREPNLCAVDAHTPGRR
jgi:hypothetical protein